MTPRTPEPPDRELSPAESAAIGRRIHQLSLTVEAPASLRARLAEAQTAQPSGSRSRRRWFALPAVAAGEVAAIFVAVIVVGGGAAGPTVDDAAALALARPTAAAPAPSGPAALNAAEAGIAFPNYSYEWPRWKAAGQRHDTIDGRDATTITYRGPKGDVGYTIVDGKALPKPDGARRVVSNGLELAIYRKDGATVVTWEQDGHTCVLAGKGEGVGPQLVKFATWA